MELANLIRLCKAYNDLGWAVQDQLNRLVDGASPDAMNPNALSMIVERFLNTAYDQFYDADDTMTAEVGELIETIQESLDRR